MRFDVLTNIHSRVPSQLLLRKKAAEELKKEQERKAAERRRIIEERCGKPKNVDDASEGTLKAFPWKKFLLDNTSITAVFFSVHRCRDQTSANNSVGVRIEQHPSPRVYRNIPFFFFFFSFPTDIDRHTDRSERYPSIYAILQRTVVVIFFFFSLPHFFPYRSRSLETTISSFFSPRAEETTNFSFFETRRFPCVKHPPYPLPQRILPSSARR